MNKQSEDIKAIREMMEKSSKFTSINGLSLVFAGIIAVIGGWCANNILSFKCGYAKHIDTQILPLLITALVVLALSVGIIALFSWRKSRKNHQSLLNSITLRAAYNLFVPLAAGGLFSLLLLLRGDVAIVAASTLIFYGLALINASKYTFSELHFLGICEVIIGLLAAIYLYHGIYWWTIGFGVLHIIFGAIMYFKYDRI